MSGRWGVHAVVLQHRPNRRVWLAKRRHVLGATDAVAVLGYHPSRTPMDVWLDKTGRAGRDRVGDSYEARRGNALERLLLAHWAATIDAEQVPVPPLVAHPGFPKVAASLDGAATRDGQLHVADAKSAGWAKRDDWWDDVSACPDHYLAQVLIQLAVTGVETGWLAADVAGQFELVGPIPRDRAWEADVLPVLQAWWETHVAADVPPPAHPLRDYRSLNRAWIPDPGEAILADEQLVALVGRYRGERAAAKAASVTADTRKGELRIAMKTATTVHADTSDGPVRIAYLDARGALSLPRTDPLPHTYDTTGDES